MTAEIQNARPTQRSSIVPLVIAFGATLVAFVVTHLLDTPASLHHLGAATGGQTILDLAPAFSADAVYDRLASLGEEGRVIYRRLILSMDLVFPASLFAFLFLLARYTDSRLHPPRFTRAILLLAPFGFFVPDMLENGVLLLLLTDYPQRHDLVASWLGYVTVIKKASFYAAAALPLGLWLIHWARARHRS